MAFITRYMSLFWKVAIFSGIRHADEQSPQSDSRAETSQFKNIPWVVYKLCTSSVPPASVRVAWRGRWAVCVYLFLTWDYSEGLHLSHPVSSVMTRILRTQQHQVSVRRLLCSVIKIKAVLTFLEGWGKQSGQGWVPLPQMCAGVLTSPWHHLGSTHCWW